METLTLSPLAHWKTTSMAFIAGRLLGAAVSEEQLHPDLCGATGLVRSRK